MAIVIALCTDDENEAFRLLCSLHMKNDGMPWDMAEVRHMQEPPHTRFKWCVFRKV